MRLSEQAKPGATGRWLLLAAVLLAAGCSSTVDGRPVAAPGGRGPAEPSLPTTPPSSAPPQTSTPTTPAPPPPTTKPGGAVALPPNDKGYVFIETKSGRTRCQITSASVGCEAQFTNSPMKDGERTNGVSITSAGTVQWILGNLGAIPVTTLDYRTYDAQGWTIVAGVEGTRFTNAATGHGMFVSIETVKTF